MSTNTSATQKIVPSRRVLIGGLIVLLGIAVTASFLWLPTDHAIIHCLGPLTSYGNCSFAGAPL